MHHPSQPLPKKSFLFPSVWLGREFTWAFVLFCFSPLSPQAEYKKDDEHFANHLQMYVSRTFTKAKKSVICAEYPMSSKFHLSKWKTYFSEFIERFLKIEEAEYLILYVKFKMWQVIFYVNSLCFPNRLKTEILNVALDWTFQFSPWWKR